MIALRTGMLALLLVLSLCIVQCTNQSTVSEHQVPTVERVRSHYLHSLHLLDSTVALMDSSLQRYGCTTASLPTLRSLFLQARLHYKKTEYLVEYYHPHTVQFINGPALEGVEENDPEQLIHPMGFQVIEELLWNTPFQADSTELHALFRNMNATVQRAINTAETGTITDEHVFDALRLEIARMITLGISGFDSPIALHSLPEADAVLHSIQEVLNLYLQRANTPSHSELYAHLQQARAFLAYHNDFASFDRLTFIAKFANPLGTTLQQVRQALGIAAPSVRRPFRATAATLFDTAAFAPSFYAPDYTPQTTAAIVELGRTLFFDPVLSGNHQRACASCHNPEYAFSDRRAKSLAFDAKGVVTRNAPGLLYAGLQSGLFHDMRTTFLEDQARTVLHNPNEMHGELQQAVQELQRSSEYITLFARAFPATPKENVPITEQRIRIALASYIRSLAPFNSRFDHYMRGDTSALSRQEHRGFNLFMGKAKCGTCHFMPLFNGTVPPVFAETDMEILGVPHTADTLHAQLDDDNGRFDVSRILLERFAFKTPTLRNVTLTAPYMHNGVYTSLEQVMDFYNRGGGAGLGITVHQTLPTDRLNLTAQEQKEIIAFLHTLVDTLGTTTRPTRLPTIPTLQAAHRHIGGSY